MLLSLPVSYSELECLPPQVQLVAYIKQRLNTGWVLGGLNTLLASQIKGNMASRHTILATPQKLNVAVEAPLSLELRPKLSRRGLAWWANVSRVEPRKELDTSLAHLNLYTSPVHLLPAKMSTASKITLGITSLSAISIVVFVHYSQRWDQEVLFYFRAHLHDQLGTNGTYRLCMLALYEIWNSNG